jgi:hypothetical protein
MSADEPGVYLRRAGSGTLADGSVVTWSLAEGSRGRRWRWTIASDAGLRHAGLVERDAAGRFGRLELETAHGMLTLHPDTDRPSAHGNVVHASGVDPIDVVWTDDDGLAIDDDPFGSAVAGWRGRGWVVRTDLQLRRDDRGDAHALQLDERGIPHLRDAREWPLEVGGD